MPDPYLYGNTSVTLDMTVTLSEIREKCPNFFCRWWRKRDTYSERRICYLGHIIIDQHRQSSFGGWNHNIVVYVWDSKELNTYCVDNTGRLKTVRDAKKFIREKLKNLGVDYEKAA